MKRLASICVKDLRAVRSSIFFKESLLIQDWDLIVGPDLSSNFSPMKIVRTGNLGFMHVYATSSSVLMAKYFEPVLLERINSFFGRKYVDSIRAHQVSSLGRNSLKTKKTYENFLPEASNLDEALSNLEKSIIHAR